ncbi:MAG: radical SAM protein [Nitrospirae bacterium]|nr:radical SAM protein [Nitrospirota bacterium]
MCANHRIDSIADSALLHQRVRDMSVEVLRQILDTFPSIKRVTFAGVGEPMLVSGVFKMVKVACDHGVHCGMVSNGTKLMARMEELLESPLSEISFSLNAGSAEKYAQLVGMPAGTFYEISEAIKELIAKRNAMGKALSVAVSSVMWRSNLSEAPEIFRHAASLGVDMVNFHNYIPDPSREGDVNEVIKLVDDSRLATVRKACERQGVASKFALPIPIGPISKKRCLSFFRSINIDGDGNVGGCLRVLPPHRNNGNILLEGREVWVNDYFKSRRQLYLDDSVPLPAACLYCVETF